MSELQIQPAAIRKSMVVKATPEKAFTVFTDGFDRWWPRTHYIGDSPLKAAIIEPRVGGRWYSVHEDGHEGLWGEVLAWEPPARLLLAWRLDHGFGYDPNLLTEVEVRFIPEGDDGTRVEFEHRHLERFGDTAAALATIQSMDGGWGMILGRFEDVANQP